MTFDEIIIIIVGLFCGYWFINLFTFKDDKKKSRKIKDKN